MVNWTAMTMDHPTIHVERREDDDNNDDNGHPTTIPATTTATTTSTIGPRVGLRRRNVFPTSAQERYDVVNINSQHNQQHSQHNQQHLTHPQHYYQEQSSSYLPLFQNDDVNDDDVNDDNANDNNAQQQSLQQQQRRNILHHHGYHHPQNQIKQSQEEFIQHEPISETTSATIATSSSLTSTSSSNHLHKSMSLRNESLSLPTTTTTTKTATPLLPPSPQQQQQQQQQQPSSINTHNNLYTYSTDTITGQSLTYLTQKLKLNSTRSGSALPGFLALLLLTMVNYMLSPMRDAAALAVGVSHIPILTLASTGLAIASSVPMGWLFEAPNPLRRGKTWRVRLGLTRGETQGTSLALFLRCFAFCLIGYAITFKLFEWFDWNHHQDGGDSNDNYKNGKSGEESSSVNEIGNNLFQLLSYVDDEGLWAYIIRLTRIILQKFGKVTYVAFFLVVHLMKLHSLSLIWGVTSEAMEYEEQAEIRQRRKLTLQEFHDRVNMENEQGNNNVKKPSSSSSTGKRSRIRLKRLAFVGFGGTLGGISGSVFVSMTTHTLRLSGLLIVAAILLFLSAELSKELGQIMLRHWEEEQKECSSGIGGSQDDLLSLSQTSSTSQNNYSNNNNEHHIMIGEAAATSTAATTTTNSSTSNNFQSPTGCYAVGVVDPSMRQVSSSNTLSNEIFGGCLDTSLKKVASHGSMKRIASGNSLSMNPVLSNGSMKRVASGHSMSNMSRKDSFTSIDACMKKVASNSSMKRVASGNSIGSIRRNSVDEMNNNNTYGKVMFIQNVHQHESKQQTMNAGNMTLDQQVIMMESCEENSFKQRLLRGITTILRSRLLMTIFTYNALYATTNTLLSFQRAELIANRSSSSNNMHSDTAFLARINIISSLAVFGLQLSGLGAYIASGLGQRGTLSLMPMVRMFTLAMLVLWHIKADGSAPNLTFFLVLDEFTKVINFAVAKPVRESLWRGLSNEARYEAKPIVDTLANRWGSDSAAVFMSVLDRIMSYTGMGKQMDDGTQSLFGFPPLLILCAFTAVWWAFVSADLGYIRHRIDLELKKQQ